MAAIAWPARSVRMLVSAGRSLVVAAACMVVLSGCETSTKLTGLFGSSSSSEPAATATTPEPDSETTTTGGVAAAATVPAGPVDGGTPNVLGKNPYDDLSLGKKYFQS